MRLNPDHFWTYSEWLFEKNALRDGAILSVTLALLGFIIGYIVSVFKYGPSEGFLRVSQIIGQLFTVDLPKLSFRRIYAMAKLAVKESIRKKILVLIGIFIVAMMFAGWYLDPDADSPVDTSCDVRFRSTIRTKNTYRLNLYPRCDSSYSNRIGLSRDDSGHVGAMPRTVFNAGQIISWVARICISTVTIAGLARTTNEVVTSNNVVIQIRMLGDT